MLAPDIHTLLGVDTASGMTDAFTKKLNDVESPVNLACITHLLTTPDSPELQAAAAKLHAAVSNSDTTPASPPPYRFDLAVSHLTLHHIPSLPEIFALLYACLRPGGCVALTDYEDFGHEAVRFHPMAKRPGVERHGLKGKEVAGMLEDAGFVKVRVEEAFVLKKEVDDEEAFEVLDGREMGFPFLVCFAVRT